MLLVTFHGGDGGINNVYAYDTTTKAQLSPTALATPTTGALDELRAIVSANGQLYVVSGGKSASQVFCYGLPNASGQCAYVSLVIGPTLSKTKQYFKTAISHPYGIAFSNSSTCYISNQDTNVVAQVQMTNNVWSLGTGSQSDYLNQLTSICPTGGCSYLDGTFVASQDGTLPDIDTAATDVPSINGGLSVNLVEKGKKDKEKEKVQNSVRDVAVVGGVLLVCDEPSQLLRLYALPAGTYLGSGATLPGSPTHLTVTPGGLYVSAGEQVYWSALGSSPTPSGLCFTSVLTAPSGTKVGGISFDSTTGTVYVPFQAGTGDSTTKGGSIVTYSVTQATPTTLPVLSNQQNFQTGLTDTPEFVTFV
jgi:hypothetical protein